MASRSLVLQVEQENAKQAKPHEVCINSASHEILREKMNGRTHQMSGRRKEQYSNYFELSLQEPSLSAQTSTHSKRERSYHSECPKI